MTPEHPVEAARQPFRKKKGTTVHVPISGDLHTKLEEMRAVDRRSKNDFVRLLIEDEWTRRQAKANGSHA
jgi:hypothetical protein